MEVRVFNDGAAFRHIIAGDSKGDSFLIALNRADGKTLWRENRTNKGISYSAPFIRELAGGTQMIQCGDRCATSFDPDTGEQLWTVDGPSQEFVATPVTAKRPGWYSSAAVGLSEFCLRFGRTAGGT